MIKITDGHDGRLARVAPALVRPALGEELAFQAKEIAEDAAFSIIEGGISGPGHVASAPGEPPNADTHALDQSIRPLELVETPGEIRTGVIADSDHALYQERGTSKMEARPFLEPATERHRADVLQALHGRFHEMLGG
jgi:HK97 gp10 family phage protein